MKTLPSVSPWNKLSLGTVVKIFGNRFIGLTYPTKCKRGNASCATVHADSTPQDTDCVESPLGLSDLKEYPLQSRF